MVRSPQKERGDRSGEEREEVLSSVSVPGSAGGTERGSRSDRDCTGVQHPSDDGVSLEVGVSGEGGRSTVDATYCGVE